MKRSASHTLFPLATAAAAYLGTSRATLYRALRGQFVNPELVKRYRNFVNAHLDAVVTQPAAESAKSAAEQAEYSTALAAVKSGARKPTVEQQEAAIAKAAANALRNQAIKAASSLCQ